MRALVFFCFRRGALLPFVSQTEACLLKATMRCSTNHPITPSILNRNHHHTQPKQTPKQSYRVLFNTLMDGEPDIEDGLVQRDSPFAGTRRFGMCYVDGTSGRMAT
jgi:hypothetical protein